MDDAEAIKSVKAALDLHSQPSSSVCQKANTWTVVNTLTNDAATVFQNEEALHSTMSIRTFRRIMHRHLREYKRARTLTDYCQHCADLEDSVLPEIRKPLEHWKQRLEDIVAAYFAP